MAPSTFAYFQALVGTATEVHWPALAFFHNKHNVCMRRRKADSHFGQVLYQCTNILRLLRHCTFYQRWYTLNPHPTPLP